MAVTVTRFLLMVATCRLEMSAGTHAALAGMLTGPTRQASQAPVTSVPPARDRTMSRHGWFSGSPQADSRMLLPHEVLVSVRITRTCVTGFAPDSVMAAGGEFAAGWLAPG
jgi:hypothetical protein